MTDATGTSLAEWLLARLDEDEVVARAAKGRRSGAWTCRAHESDPWIVVDGDDFVVHDDGRPSDEEAEHIARHDPARVLAEVAAKRALLKAVEDDPFEALGAESAYESLVWEYLALPYADAPGYRPEWAP